MLSQHMFHEEFTNKFTDPDDLKTNREYQSTIFTTYFGVPVKAAQLYEGITSQP
ncbi:MAG: hypothetical protein HFG78_04410 [Hungatella sp.]|nr:hypothetical protein [Hungatella sp.]MCI9500425.1 hypothetical protein [Hungatella sp.]MCI9635003.1 hypothetical protein [Hungatella sp.]